MVIITDLIDQLNELLANFTTFQIPKYTWIPTVAIALTVVVGLIYCFFGYKAVRVLATIVGIILGLIVGGVVVSAAKLQSPFTIVVPIAGAVIFGILGFFLYRIGVFIVVLLAAFSITGVLLVSYTKLDQTVILIVSLVVGVILAVLSVVYLRPIVILSTALSGGMMISNEIFQNLVMVRWSPMVETITRLGVGLLLAVFGIIYQFKTTKPSDD